jgi:hypothetical protein
MAIITNTMNRTISNSKKQNRIIPTLIKSLLVGMIGYSIFILALIGSCQLISNLFKLGSSQIDNTVLIASSVGYLALYTLFLIRELKNNNFRK